MIGFKLPSPHELSEIDRENLMRSSLVRTWDGAEELKSGGYLQPELQGRATYAEMWMLLIIRTVTRIVEPPREVPENDEAGKKSDREESTELDFYLRQDKLRQILCDYIMSDFSGRYAMSPFSVY
jgi:symplekin